MFQVFFFCCIWVFNKWERRKTMEKEFLFKRNANNFILVKFGVPNGSYDLELGIKLAVAEYCSQKEVSYSVNEFNYEDVIFELPNEYCIQQGFVKIEMRRVKSPIKLKKTVTSSAEIFALAERLVR